MKKIGLVQINNSFSGQSYFPYSVGILQAYAQQYLSKPENYIFLDPIFNRQPVKTAVESLKDADLVFFSTYVWNIRISLEIAKNIKSQNPETIIVFGGPHVPDKAESFMRQNPHIDLACHGEGEKTFTAILENMPNRNWSCIQAVSYVKKGNSFVQGSKIPRIDNLDSIPSPYLEGIFLPIIEANPNERWIGIWETNRGCPFSCTYCDWGSLVHKKMCIFSLERLYKELEWFADHKVEFIFCADSNFGILPRDIDIVTHAAKIKKERGYPHALSVQSTKNATERSYLVSKILSDAGLNKGVSLSLQSQDPQTLMNIKRNNISQETFRELQRRFTRDKIETFTDLILGLPGETYESFTHGVAQVIANGQHNRIQFNNLSILPNAEMGDLEYQKKYGIQTITNKIVNIHGATKTLPDEIFETQELVIATNSMPQDDWAKTRAFSWMTAFLHFDKVFQIPLVLLHEVNSINYRDLIEIFSEKNFSDGTILYTIQTFFKTKAENIQKGEEEFCQSKEWLNIWWPADELMTIQLCAENKLNIFYDEVKKAIIDFFNNKNFPFDHQLLDEAIEINKNLMKLPFQKENQTIKLSYNIWEFYRGILTGSPIPLQKNTHTYIIDKSSKTWGSWEDWCREVIWWGNKKGAYMYNIISKQ